jgi:hypothetical protein
MFKFFVSEQNTIMILYAAHEFVMYFQSGPQDHLGRPPLLYTVLTTFAGLGNLRDFKGFYLRDQVRASTPLTFQR